MFIRKIGIDLGTANTLVCLPKKGIVINEPTVVAVSIDDNRVVAVGAVAKGMIGRAPESIMVYQPMRDGVIADFRITQTLLRYFIEKVIGRVRFFRPEVLVAVPAGITSTERRAVVEAALAAGAKSAYVAKEPVLSAIGAGVPINSAAGNLVIDIGGGTSEIAVISLGGVVAWASVRIGGNKIDQAITDYIRKRHNLIIGEQVAEKVKITVGTALPQKKEKIMEIRGRDLLSGLPQTIAIRNNEIPDAVGDELRDILQGIKKVLQETPPELAADIIDRGMVLSGGGSLLRNFDKLITQATDVPCFRADEPLLCVAKGTGIVLEHLELYKRSLMSNKR
ncbi:MAG: rod shape-determining protein [Candidatus Portnoybacteria bacterium CG06_land_8_20_14_3_00_39_12]|uniref:Cell shape-determining protein MreB n=3 Tax=Candidatus Portnoyibacteriota TaxID=1817913 RepID=A0A2M8KGF5_9BACT|nr:MAG: rod shape-determining protein [Parcubacteria group bacterium CG1_02_40_25]PIU75047.1 MAG: rod shape-determining protein [Candidatus Portnoybacteria bacterium CG06_land_8_20_14_3_00_39_12]PIZ70434.1 MAG: rod shape-determining protein [Candidatus Portnoybacteria bacterium CG_4_10_14_0_2_um_filter_39_11]PJE59004.1 MAG: rod shape-determining protein [Candidatus Portnoybacteria bacterium CG10_big_fil_rev_8_21_14_0_10_40_22]